MGRRKIEIKPIGRKNGLFKKAYELGVLCSVDVAVIIFEERAGHHVKLYEYCSTDIDAMVQRHIHFDGEKDARSPTDFNNKPDDGPDDDDDDDDDDAPGKRRDSLRAQKPKAGKMVPMKHSAQNNMAMGIEMDYRHDISRQMSIPQAPMHHMQMSSSGSMPANSPSTYTSGALPVSIERHTPSAMPASKKQRLDPASAAYGYLDDSSSPSAHSPSYRMQPQFLAQPHGPGGPNPSSPNAPFFQPSMGFPARAPPPPPRQQSQSQSQSQQQQQQQQQFPQGYSQGYPHALYPPANPFAALLGPTPQGAGPPPGGSAHAHGPPSFEPLDWPEHHPGPGAGGGGSGSGNGGGNGGGAYAPPPSVQRASLQPAHAAGSAGTDTSWLELFGAPQGLQQQTQAHAHDGSRPGTAQPAQARRLDDSWERGSPHHSTHSGGGGGAGGISPTQQHKRPRSESNALSAGASSQGNDEPDARAGAPDAKAANGNGNGNGGAKDGDAPSDASVSAASGERGKRQRWGDL